MNFKALPTFSAKIRIAKVTIDFESGIILVYSCDMIGKGFVVLRAKAAHGAIEVAAFSHIGLCLDAQV